MNLREKLTTQWGAPSILYPHAEEDRLYLLVMVDPDAPSRSNPRSAYWKHWLVTDLQGSKLRNGTLQGTTVTDYLAPSPPPASGFHRYQFLLYDQPPIEAELITEQKKSRRGQWDLMAFIHSFNLGSPVAQVQFLTQNYKD
ncbi:phosphatidylethanolamine-binding protein 4 isoform X2 [Corythoichthys intestinalis]|nr:phosphatidylethanolamine-binding protein 4 isoform X2 [Corythoichthys intestinalis]